MRVDLRVWRPIARRWGTRGLIVAGIAAGLLLVGGGGVMAQLLGGTTRTADSSDINLQKGLVGWWKMDGNANDSSPYRNNGTVYGATLMTDREGKANSAYSFNGSTSNINVPNSSSVQITGSQTISFWVYSTSFSGRKNPYNKAYGGEGTITQETDGTYNYYYGTSGANSAPYQGFSMTSAVSLNTWTHLTLVRNLSAMTLTWYKNGVQVNQAPASYAAATVSTNAISIGNGYAGYFAGKLDDMRLYNRALSSTEVTALYKQYDPGLKSDSGEKGLIGWWKMDGNANDSSPFRQNGTLNLGPTLVADRKGRANSAYSFNGTTNQYITVPDSPSLRLNNGAFSISFWAQDNASTASYPGIAIKGSSAGSGTGWLIYFAKADHKLCYKRDNASSCTSTTAVTSSPQHFTFTWDGSNWVWYVNGVSAGSGTRSFATNTDTSAMNIGIGDSPSGNITTLDDVRMYSRSLSATEVGNIYNSYNSQINVLANPNASSSVNLFKGLVGSWDFNGNAHDSTPYRDNGTVSGATLTTDRKGRANSAYAIGGSSYINVGSPSVLNGFSGLTYNVWLMRTGASAAQWPELMGAANTHVNYGIRSQNYGDNISFEYGTSPYGSSTYDNVSAGAGSLPVNQWHMFTFTYDGSTVSAYRDGVYQTQKTSVTINPSFGGLSFGQSSAGWQGSVDDAQVWNRALSQAEITALYQEYQ